MNKLLENWGFSPEGWKTGQRGEYLVLLQGMLLIGFVLLPVYALPGVSSLSTFWRTAFWVMAGILGVISCGVIGKGVMDLGQSLTPLPYPKQDGELVQTGAYGVVRHPLYSGLILAALGWAIFQLSVSHFLGTIVLFVFFDFKARREEQWLLEKYPDYSDYRNRVKKLLPGLY
ncbi:MAG: methyltransferase family protein [Microcoleaceae cyanobacterium]